MASPVFVYNLTTLMHVHPPGCATDVMVTSKKKTNFTAVHHSMSSIRVLHLGTNSDA